MLFRQLGLLPVDVPSCVVNGSGVDVADYALAPLMDKPSFLLIARLLGDKGVREYVQAAQMVKAQHPDVVFRLVGWIDDNPDAISQQELDEWVSTGTLEFLGKLADVRPAIADSNVYVLPSYREGTPRTVLEAMAMGRPVITTDAPGCRETVTDGDNGFWCRLRRWTSWRRRWCGLLKSRCWYTKWAIAPAEWWSRSTMCIGLMSLCWLRWGLSD